MASTQADTSCTSNVYKHQPLDYGKHQIRLLKLRNQSGDDLDYSLTSFDYEDAPAYIALSYTWGEERPTGFVSIERKDYEIRQNLLNFLRTYREDEYLWIDQICIDQKNIQERNHQVSLMSKIYSRCKFVLVWLRDETKYVPSTRQAALDLNSGIDSYRNLDERKIMSSNDKTHLQRPILAIFANSYFERLWIVQELLLSKNIRLLVEGNAWLPWDLIVLKNQEFSEELSRSILVAAASWMVRMQSQRFTSMNPFLNAVSSHVASTVGMFCRNKCADPRDKVYGLMALIQPANRVEIDYTKSFQRVYLDAIMMMIKDYLFNHAVLSIFGVDEVKRLFIQASRVLANTMGFTNLEKSGLESFKICIWEKILKYEHEPEDYGCEEVADIGCDTSVDLHSGTRQLSGNRLLATPCSRWWYEFKGTRYYHDSKEWSGEASSQEYTESPEGVRLYSPDW